MNQNKIKRSHLQLFALLLVFALPVLICLAMYKYPSYFSLRTTQHGVLVNPPLQPEGLSLNMANEHKWQIVYATRACTTQQADKAMFSLHQLRKALGKDSLRVVLTLLTDHNCQLKDTHDFRKVVYNDAQFNQLPEATVYLVDPAGNLFMYYPSGSEPMDIMKDLKHVLGVSQIG